MIKIGTFDWKYFNLYCTFICVSKQSIYSLILSFKILLFELNADEIHNVYVGW